MAFVRNVSTSMEILPAANARALVGTTANTGTIFDTQGYQSITFVMTCAAAAAASTPQLSAAYGQNTSYTYLTAVPNSACPIGLNTTIQVLELARPTQRYVAPVMTPLVNATVTVVAILSGREPQALGSGNPVSNMIPQNSAFNTTTAEFPGVSNMLSSSNTPTSILLLANP